jgi:hypothetical protein
MFNKDEVENEGFKPLKKVSFVVLDVLSGPNAMLLLGRKQYKGTHPSSFKTSHQSRYVI